MAMVWFDALDEYEYAMRVDEDVCIMRLPRHSLLAALAAEYSFGLETRESHLETVQTFNPWVQDYMAAEALAPKMPPLPSDRMYFSNFFVSRVAWWTQPHVRRFLFAINASHGIFRHRWGDAPIQSAALRLHASQEQMVHLEVDYLHMSTLNRIRSGEEVPFDAESIQNAHFRQLAQEALTRRDDLANQSNTTGTSDSAKQANATWVPDVAAPPGPTACIDTSGAFASVELCVSGTECHHGITLAAGVLPMQVRMQHDGDGFWHPSEGHRLPAAIRTTRGEWGGVALRVVPSDVRKGWVLGLHNRSRTSVSARATFVTTDATSKSRSSWLYYSRNDGSAAGYNPLHASQRFGCSLVSSDEGATLDAQYRNRLFDLVEQSHVVLRKLTLINGFAGNVAGFMQIFRAFATVSDCNIVNSHASSFGGAIVIVGGGILMTDCSFRNASCGHSGGVMDITDAIVTLARILTVDAYAERFGGVMVARSTSAVVVSNSSMVNSSTALSGGVLCIDLGSITVTNQSRIHNCTAVRSGGALWMADGSMTLSYGSFITNARVNGYGGAMYIGQGFVTVSNGSKIINSTAEFEFGGAFSIIGGVVT
eukprot:3130150-Prymnesium_polylepis.1